MRNHASATSLLTSFRVPVWQTSSGAHPDPSETTGTLRQLPKPLRIAIVGASGSGKTTLALELSRRLGVRHIWADRIAATSSCDDHDLATVLEVEMRQERWVVDAILDVSLLNLIVRQGVLLIWLDYPFLVTAMRLLVHEVRRANHAAHWPYMLRKTKRSWHDRQYLRRILDEFSRPGVSVTALRFKRPSQALEWLVWATGDIPDKRFLRAYKG